MGDPRACRPCSTLHGGRGGCTPEVEGDLPVAGIQPGPNVPLAVGHEPLPAQLVGLRGPSGLRHDPSQALLRVFRGEGRLSNPWPDAHLTPLTTGLSVRPPLRAMRWGVPCA